MAKIDVLIPCYNYGRYLETCVNSVLNQSTKDLRILIIDDASSDNTNVVAERLANSDSRVNLIRHTKNRGHINTYNEGIEWAEAEYFLLISADDLLAPGALERAIRILDEDRFVMMTYGDCIEWRDDTPLPQIVPPLQPLAWAPQDLLKMICTTGLNPVATATAIVRTSAQKAAGGYLPTLPHSGDMEMWLRFAVLGAVVKIDAVQAIYRKHAAAMSTSYQTFADFEQRKRAFDSFFSSPLGNSSDLRSQRQIADRNLAAAAFRAGALHFRRGRFESGWGLLRLANAFDPRLRYRPPVWQFLKVPGPAGREWAASMVKRKALQLIGRSL